MIFHSLFGLIYLLSVHSFSSLSQHSISVFRPQCSDCLRLVSERAIAFLVSLFAIGCHPFLSIAIHCHQFLSFDASLLLFSSQSRSQSIISLTKSLFFITLYNSIIYYFIATDRKQKWKSENNIRLIFFSLTLNRLFRRTKNKKKKIEWESDLFK